MVLSFRYYNPQEPQLIGDFPNSVLPVSPAAFVYVQVHKQDTRNAKKLYVL